MKARLQRWLVAAVLVVGACGRNDGTSGITSPGDSITARIQVINASDAPVSLVVDGQIVMQSVSARSLSGSVAVTAGSRSVELRSQAGATLAQLNVTASTGQVITVASMTSANNSFQAEVVSDTGAVVAAGFGKLRVLHLAGSAPILEIWRTQPDFQTPIRFAFPFTYGSNSGFDQSTPGTWDVRVWRPTTDADNAAHWASPDAQLTIDVPSGVVKTVAVLDAVSGSGFQIQVVP